MWSSLIRGRVKGLTLLFGSRDHSRNSSIGIPPHHVSDVAMHTIAAQDQVSFFHATISQDGLDSLVVVNDIDHCGSRPNLRLVRGVLVENLQESASFEDRNWVTMTVLKLVIWAKDKRKSKAVLFPGVFEEITAQDGPPVRQEVLTLAQRDTLGFHVG